jgi:ketosteroid isomerase-like protein
MNATEMISEIEATDARREQAVIARDMATLNEILGEDLIYVHSSGMAEDRSLYLSRVAEGFYVYRGFEILARQYRFFGDTVLVNADIKIDVVARGNAKLLMSRVCQAWVRRDGRWQLVTWHSTLMPAA